MTRLIPAFMALASTLALASQPVDLDQHLNEALKNGSASHTLNANWPGLSAANHALELAGLKPEGAWRAKSIKSGDVAETGCSFITTFFSVNTPTQTSPEMVWVYETRAPHCPKQD